MDADEERHARVEHEFRLAVASSSLRLHFQPVVTCDGCGIVGFEALARWKSPTLGDVPPGVFVPIAEECGLVREVSEQLLRRACASAVSWPNEVRLMFNLAGPELQDPGLALRVLHVAAETGLDPRRLELEVCESALGGDVAIAKAVFSELRQAGVRIALDGFGSGLATVSQLLALRFDRVKMSREIVGRLDDNAEGVVVAKGIVSLTTALGIDLSAVGVETQQQLTHLREVGCREWQGFLYAKPMAAGMLPALLRRSASEPRTMACFAARGSEGTCAQQVRHAKSAPGR
jgi:EAL domain-containing protein (putative c-di-GMP-specific phosphodiesterase class I)